MDPCRAQWCPRADTCLFHPGAAAGAPRATNLVARRVEEIGRAPALGRLREAHLPGSTSLSARTRSSPFPHRAATGCATCHTTVRVSSGSKQNVASTHHPKGGFSAHNRLASFDLTSAAVRVKCTHSTPIPHTGPGTDPMRFPIGNANRNQCCSHARPATARLPRNSLWFDV